MPTDTGVSPWEGHRQKQAGLISRCVSPWGFRASTHRYRSESSLRRIITRDPTGFRVSSAVRLPVRRRTLQHRCFSPWGIPRSRSAGGQLFFDGGTAACGSHCPTPLLHEPTTPSSNRHRLSTNRHRSVGCQGWLSYPGPPVCLDEPTSSVLQQCGPPARVTIPDLDRVSTSTSPRSSHSGSPRSRAHLEAHRSRSGGKPSCLDRPTLHQT